MKSVSRKELIFLCIYRVGFDVFKFGLVGIELPKGRFRAPLKFTMFQIWAVKRLLDEDELGLLNSTTWADMWPNTHIY